MAGQKRDTGDMKARGGGKSAYLLSGLHPPAMREREFHDLAKFRGMIGGLEQVLTLCFLRAQIREGVRGCPGRLRAAA